MNTYNFIDGSVQKRTRINEIRDLFMTRYCQKPYKQPRRIPSNFSVTYMEGRGVEIREVFDRWNKP